MSEFWTWFWMIIIALIFVKVKLMDDEAKAFARREEHKYYERQFKELVKEAMKDE